MLAAVLASAAGVYFGDLHVHTSFSSDATGAPNELVEIARDEEGLDFIAITDHDTDLEFLEWEYTRSLARSVYDPGVFVAFSGIEYTQRPHLAVYFLNDHGPLCPSCESLQDFYDFYGTLLGTREAVAHLAHPVTCCSGSVANLDDSLIRNVEIWNGRHESYNQEYGEFGTVDLLAQGHRLGFLGGSDDHALDGSSSHGRRVGETLTGCHAASLTRTALLEALHDRRCFTTDNLRTVVDLDVAGVAMGGEAAVCADDAFAVELFVSGTQTPSNVQILRDGVVVASRTNCISPDCDLTAILASPETFSDVYGRVRHDPSSGCVNCKTWSSPVRVTASTAPNCLPEPAQSATLLCGFALLLGLARTRSGRG